MCAAARAPRQAGFSLVEVLCAVAISAMAITVLSAGVTQALRSARALDMHQGARLILQSILEDELAAGDSAPGLRQGDSGPYRWQLEIKPAAAAVPGRLAPPYRMLRLTAAVSWERGGEASASVLKLAR